MGTESGSNYDPSIMNSPTKERRSPPNIPPVKHSITRSRPVNAPEAPDTVISNRLDLEKVFRAVALNEGFTNYMYLDTTDNVTVGYGIMLPNADAATDISFHVIGASPNILAPKDLIRRDWARVYNSMTVRNNQTAPFFESMTTVRVTERVGRELTFNYIKADIERCKNGPFPQFDSYPIPAQEAILDLTYNVGFRDGIIKGFPTFTRLIQERKFAEAAPESHRESPPISEVRNDYVRDLLLEAAKIERSRSQ